MAQTLQNQITYAKSMSGVISLSDGNGTIITNGTITSNDISGNNITTNTFNTTDLTLPRKNTALIPLLGSNIDLDLLIQNLNFNTINRNFEIWDDQATGQMMTWDVSDNIIQIHSDTLSIFPATSLDFNCPAITFTSSSVSFPNSTLTIPRTSTPSLNAFLGSTINVGSLIQNLNFNTINRNIEIWDDQATGQMMTWDVSDNDIQISSNTMSIFPTILDLSSPAITFTDSNVSFPNSNVSFNTFLPTSTIATTTGGTQFITRAIGDGRFGQLAATNTFTLQNTFRNGILPCSGTRTTDIQLGGNNQLQYRQATSENNISIGNNTLRGDSNALGVVNNTGSRNIGIGGENLVNLDTGSDNIFIGYQAGSGVQPTRVVGVNPSRCIAIGNYSQSATNLYSTDSVSIGHNSLINVSSGNENVCIGSNTGNGLNFQGFCVLIGSNCAPTVNDNGVTAIGANCMRFATGSFNSGVAIGGYAGAFNNGGQGGTFIGGGAGYANTTGNYNTCIGLQAGYSSTPTINNGICIGYNSVASSDYECVFGGESSTEQVFLTLPRKHRLSCNQSATGTSFNILFRTNENIIIDNTVTSIILPTPDATGVNIGAKFNLLKTTSASNITINAPSGQTIGFINTSGVYTTAATYTFTASTNNISVLCIANTGTSWLVINNNGFVDLTNNQTIAGIKTFSSPPVMSGASITASTIPSTAINNSSFVDLTNNQTSIAGTKTFTGNIILKKYHLSMVNPTVIFAAGTTMGPTLYEYTKVNFAGGTIILPLSANVEIGTVLRFRKLGNIASAIQVTPNTGQSIYPRNSVIPQVTLTDIMGGGSAYGSVLFIGTATWAILD